MIKIKRGAFNGDQGWRSGENAHLPPVWPGFDSWSRRHTCMWVESVFGSHPCFKGFSPGTLVFFPPQKPTFQILIRSGNRGDKSHSMDSTEIHIYLLLFLVENVNVLLLKVCFVF